MSAPAIFLPRKHAAVLIGETRVHPFTAEELTNLVADVIRRSRKRVFGNHNLHSLYLFHRDARMREFYEQADYIHADGMSLIVLGRLFGLPLRREHRVTYADWTDILMRRASEEEWRVFYLGSKPGVAAQGAGVLTSRYTNLNIKTAHGYFDASPGSEENRQVLAAIRNFRPNLLMIGMSMPRQELWVLDNLAEIDANAILVCGAAMDYIAGVVPTPPRWAGRSGLEWLFRLCHEPTRLWRRYLAEPWFTLWMLFTSSLLSTRPSDVSSQDQEASGD